MSTHFASSFSAIELSTEDSLQAAVLSNLQKQGLQNEIVVIAEQLLNLVFDPLNPIQFGLDQSYLKGRLEFGKFILEQSDLAYQTLAARVLEANSREAGLFSDQKSNLL